MKHNPRLVFQMIAVWAVLQVVSAFIWRIPEMQWATAVQLWQTLPVPKKRRRLLATHGKLNPSPWTIMSFQTKSGNIEPADNSSNKNDKNSHSHNHIDQGY